jgi:hypothetical protein
MFKRPPFWNGWSYKIKNFAIEVNFNGITCLPYFMKIHQSVQKLLRGFFAPPQKFKRPPFWNGWNYEIKNFVIEVNFNGITCLPYFMKIHRSVQKLLRGFFAPPQKFKRPPFWNGWSYEITNFVTEVNFNGITCLPYFMKIHLSVQKLLVGHTHTHRQPGNLISLF